MAERERNEMLGFAPPIPIPDDGSGELVDRSDLPDPAPREQIRRIRSDGIPHGIRDACSECAEVAWEECFLRGQCRNYVQATPREQGTGPVEKARQILLLEGFGYAGSKRAAAALRDAGLLRPELTLGEWRAIVAAATGGEVFDGDDCDAGVAKLRQWLAGEEEGGRA